MLLLYLEDVCVKASEIDKPSDPIHALFLGVLYTAVQDLRSINTRDKENALQFFLSEGSWLPKGISYKDVLNVYSLKEKHSMFIQNLVENALKTL